MQLAKYILIDCNKTNSCMNCKYTGLCFEFEESIVEIDSDVFNRMREKVFGG